MGYNTYYKLEWIPVDGDRYRAQCEHEIRPGDNYCPECGAAIGQVAIIDDIARYIDSDDNLRYATTSGECTWWYEHDKDMRALSQAFPQYIFTLDGDSEESGDIWRKYYLNSKYQEAKAQIIFADFDVGKLE